MCSSSAILLLLQRPSCSKICKAQLMLICGHCLDAGACLTACTRQQRIGHSIRPYGLTCKIGRYFVCRPNCSIGFLCDVLI